MKVYRLPSNPVTLVEKRPNKRRPGIDVFSREEVMALVREAALEQDGDALPHRGIYGASNGRAAGPFAGAIRFRAGLCMCDAASPGAGRPRAEDGSRAGSPYGGGGRPVAGSVFRQRDAAPVTGTSFLRRSGGASKSSKLGAD